MTDNAVIEMIRTQLADARNRAAIIQQEIAVLERLVERVDSEAVRPGTSAAAPATSRVQPPRRTPAKPKTKPQTKLRGKVTARIYQFVHNNPGLTLTEIGERLGPEFPDMKNAPRNIYNTAHAMARGGRLFKTNDLRAYVDEATWRRLNLDE